MQMRKFDPNFRRPAMRVDMEALRQQQWRGEKLFTEMRRYAEQIGCTFGTGACCDEVMCTDAQARLLAKWWTEHTS
jgi:hypothetical protein